MVPTHLTQNKSQSPPPWSTKALNTLPSPPPLPLALASSLSPSLCFSHMALLHRLGMVLPLGLCTGQTPFPRTTCFPPLPLQAFA